MHLPVSAKQQLSNVAPKAAAPELSDSAKTVLTLIQRASPDSQKAMLANLDTQAPDIASQAWRRNLRARWLERQHGSRARQS